MLNLFLEPLACETALGGSKETGGDGDDGDEKLKQREIPAYPAARENRVRGLFKGGTCASTAAGADAAVLGVILGETNGVTRVQTTPYIIRGEYTYCCCCDTLHIIFTFSTLG